ncbi:MAG: FAD-dependent oxidoreductase [Lautropia sp.]
MLPLKLIRLGLLGRGSQPDLPPTPALRRHYDVVIIGGGGHGLAIAYFLASRHRVGRIAVIERSYLGGGNTARNTQVVRANYITPEAIRFYGRSLELYRGLSEELGFNVMFSARGQLTLAQNDAAVRGFRLRAEANSHMSIDSVLVDRKQIRELCPALSLMDDTPQPVLAGLWHPVGGMARHDAVAWGFARAAARLGVELHQQTAVLGIDVDGGQVRGVRTTRGDIEAGAVVQAVAGASSEVAAMAGIRLPIVTYPLQALVTQPLKPFVDPLVSAPAYHCYVSQSPRGEAIIGGGSDPYPLYSTRVTLEMKEELLHAAATMFPCLAGAKVLRQWAGMTDMTPDYSPIMGASGVRNYYLDAGWGTWGFKATPVCGETMAEMVATGRVPRLIESFGLSRFAEFRQVNEMGATAASH